MTVLEWCDANQGSIKGISSDSRNIKPGWIFVAVKGEKQDGNLFIDSCFKQGAIAVIGTAARSPSANERYFRVQQNDHARQLLAQLSVRFFKDPSKSLLMVGITGTSGKTSVSYIVESLLKTRYKKVGVIGTVEYRVGDQVIPSTHTTPGAFELQALLRQMKEQGAEAVVMEVSSHALKQFRTFGIAFDGLIFTNLSPEHLDYHPDMEDYFGAKAMLFLEYPVFAAHAGKKVIGVINQECEWGEQLQKLAAAQSLLKLEAVPSRTNLRQDRNGILGEVYGAKIQSLLTGEMNVSNLLCGLALAKGLGFSATEMEVGIKNLRGIPGRLEKIGTQVWVDYAHKPDALEKVLSTLKALKGKNSKLVCVFGCGGDRDRKKRPVMGQIAAKLADRVIVTSDNSRAEDPEQIIGEILAGITTDQKTGGRVEVMLDRRQAIGAAVAMLGPEDLLLVAGKGHETTQTVMGSDGKVSKVYFDDREVVREFLTPNQKNK